MPRGELLCQFFIKRIIIIIIIVIIIFFSYQNVQKKLQEYRDQFETIKEEQNKKIESLNKELKDDSAKLQEMQDKKVALTSEVENLEKIRSVLPDWCQGDSNEGD